MEHEDFEGGLCGGHGGEERVGSTEVVGHGMRGESDARN